MAVTDDTRYVQYFTSPTHVQLRQGAIRPKALQLLLEQVVLF